MEVTAFLHICGKPTWFERKNLVAFSPADESLQLYTLS